MTWLRARTVQLPALAVVLAHGSAAEATDHRELRMQLFPLGFRFRKRGLGHG